MAKLDLRCIIIFVLSSLTSKTSITNSCSDSSGSSVSCTPDIIDQALKNCREEGINGVFDCYKNKKINFGKTYLEIAGIAVKCIMKWGKSSVRKKHFMRSVAKHRRDNLTDHHLGLPSGHSTRHEKDDVYVQIPQEAMHAAFGTGDKEVTTNILWFQGGLFPVEEANSSLLNDRVVSIELGKTISGLTNNIAIIFFHQNASLENATCVFWDTVKSSSGSKLVWNSAGCSSEQEDGRIICSCDHLSFFAVLLSPVYEKPASASGIATQVSPPLSAYTVWVLTVLTRIGCGVSVCSLALVLTFHAVFRRNNSEHSLSIHIHLCVALFGLNLSFLINDSLASLNVHAACIFIAAATHYTLLCTLIWFAIEGFHLYLLVVRVFNVIIERYLLKLAVAGWGLPAVAVISILSSGKYGRYNIYKLEGGTETMCYLPHSVLTILTFSLFVLVILVNVVVYTVVTVQVVRAWYYRTAQQEKRVSKRDIFSLLGVSWLLGMTWGVALFQFGPLKEAAAYMFCIFNIFHGVFLSLRYFTLTY